MTKEPVTKAAVDAAIGLLLCLSLCIASAAAEETGETASEMEDGAMAIVASHLRSLMDQTTDDQVREVLREELPDVETVGQKFGEIEQLARESDHALAIMGRAADVIVNSRPYPAKELAMKRMVKWATGAIDSGHPVVARWQALDTWTRACFLDYGIVPSYDGLSTPRQIGCFVTELCRRIWFRTLVLA